MQPRNSAWAAMVGGLLMAAGHLHANGFGGGNEAMGTATASTGAAVSAGGSRGGVGVQTTGAVRSAPMESGRAYQPAAQSDTRGASSGNSLRERAMVDGNQPILRGNTFVADRRPVAAGNAWTEGSQTAQQQQQRGYSYYQSNNRQHGYRRAARPYPYLYQYYGGYYPVYIDVPVYYQGDLDANGDYDGGPSATIDNGNAPSPNVAVVPQDSSNQPAATANPAAPAAQSDAAQGNGSTAQPSLGPDSLVEAVQAELTRRGYYQGKVDAMFSSDTAASLRRFQQDNYLAPTGHLNEPTLHALNLD